VVQTADERAENVELANRQEQEFCRELVGGVAFRIAGGKPVDCLAFMDSGYVDIVECKASNKDEFIITKADMDKCIQLVRDNIYKGIRSRLVVEIWLPHHKIKRKCIFDEHYRGGCLRVKFDEVKRAIRVRELACNEEVEDGSN